MKTGVIPKMSSRELVVCSQSICYVNNYCRERNIPEISNGIFEDETSTKFKDIVSQTGIKTSNNIIMSEKTIAQLQKISVFH